MQMILKMFMFASIAMAKDRSLRSRDWAQASCNSSRERVHIAMDKERGCTRHVMYVKVISK